MENINLIPRLDKILGDIGVIQIEIDKGKTTAVDQMSRLKVGAMIARVMAHEVEFHTICDILQKEFENDLGKVLSIEQLNVLDNIKQKTAMDKVNVIDGKVVFNAEMQKIFNGK